MNPLRDVKTNLTDTVLKEVMKGCRRQIKSELKTELAAMKKDNILLRKELKAANSKLKRLENLDQKKVKKDIQVALRKVDKVLNAVDRLKNQKIGYLAQGEPGWTTLGNQERKAVASIRKLLNKKTEKK